MTNEGVLMSEVQVHDTAEHSSSEPLRVALLGCGTVGSQVARMILTRGDDIIARVGRPLEIAGISVAHVDRPRQGLDSRLFTTDSAALVSRPDVDIVVELMGGIDPARELILTALRSGKSVVTANKALLAAHGEELNAAAERNGVDLYYEAAVAGAIPIVRPLRESLVGDQVRQVMGIVNGTTNYVLDQMTTTGMDFEQAVAQAQQKGYAEADPTADVEGYDAAAKAALLASLAFHTRMRGDQVYREGITHITPDDIASAKDLDCVIKLLAVCEGGPEGIVARVHPALLPLSHPLASVSGAYNAVFVEAQEAERLMFLGPGAGGAPTASAVLGDVVTVARNAVRGVAGPPQAVFDEFDILDTDDIQTRFHIRIQVRDEPGVLASVAEIFSRHDVSMQTVRQTADEETAKDSSAVLTVLTHQARQADLSTCVSELGESPFVHSQPKVIRVEGMS